MKTRLYPSIEPCPCGSGLSYGDCCRKKKFRFEVDKRGNVLKAVKIHPRLKPVLEDTLTRFREVFGRKPGKDDPAMFEQYLTGEQDYWQIVERIGKSAGIRDELIFAYRRSGFIVGEHSRDLMSASEYKEWEDAMQEYFDLKAEGFDPFFVFTPLSGAEYEEYKSLVTLLDNTIIALGLALRNPKSLSDMGDYFRYLLMRRAIRSLRTIREMYNSRYDDDCLSIARTIYEAYLRMKFLRLDPGASERFAAMLAHEVGAYQTKKKKNGRPNYDVCVDPETGEEYKITITNREILDISDFPMEEQLYYELYPLLSGYVHPELVEDALRSMIAKDASVESEGDPVRAIILILTISVLFLLEVARSPFLRVRTRRDVHHVVKQIQKGLLTLITSASMLKQMTVPLSVYELFGVDLEFPHANRDPAPAA